MKSPAQNYRRVFILIGAALSLASCSEVQVAKTCSTSYIKNGNETLETCEEQTRTRAPASAKVSGERDWNSDERSNNWMMKLPRKAQ